MNIGIKVPEPKEKCEDPNCPFHGTLRVRGNSFVGTVKSAKAALSATVEWERRIKIPKFERYEKRYSKVHAHNPKCINAQEGDKVQINECKPISKTKTFVIVQKF